MRLCPSPPWAKSAGGAACELCKGVGHKKQDCTSPGGPKHTPQEKGGTAHGREGKGKANCNNGKARKSKGAKGKGSWKGRPLLELLVHRPEADSVGVWCGVMLCGVVSLCLCL